MEEKRTKLQIGCLIATGAVFILFLALYLTMSFRVECTICGETFTTRQEGSSTLFSGRLYHQNGTIAMTSQGEATAFAFDFSPPFTDTYQVTLGEETTLLCTSTDSFGEPGEQEEALVRPVTVTDGQGDILLDAYYQDSWMGYFWDEEGNALESGSPLVITSSAGSWEDFQPPLGDLVQLAAGDKEPVRREVAWGAFFLFSLMGAVLALNIAFPRTFFYLEHFLSVRDPEPSDFYLAVMPIGWVLSPLLLAACYTFCLFA